ncbi:MAG: DAK2 domain-containing protein [Culicoidibacterales bacterium]
MRINNERLTAVELIGMLQLAAQNLEANSEFVNSLNVFPVPDGDTGTNMSLTIKAGAKHLENKTYASVAEVTKSFSHGLLMGARGNSGVILSQIFRGFHQGVGQCETLHTGDFAKALQVGAEIAYKSVMKPIEGTILTVIRETAEAAEVLAPVYPKFADFLEKLLVESNKSLKSTMEILPVLKEVGVVDSGGQGLVIVLESFLKYLNGDTAIVSIATEDRLKNLQLDDEHGEDEFGFCTEFIIRLHEKGDEDENKSFFETTLTEMGGQSLVVVAMDDLIKVHVHTEQPLEVFAFAQKHGEFVTLKSENMQTQFENNQHVDKGTKKEKVDQLLLSVSAGSGVSEFFQGIGVHVCLEGGQTMNPSTEDFIELIDKYETDNIILLPNNSNIILAAEQVKALLEDKTVVVIPTKTIPQGIASTLAFNPMKSIEENTNAMIAAISTVKSGQVTYAVRDTTMNGVEVKKDDFLAIFEKEIVASKPNQDEILNTLLAAMIDEDSELVTLVVGCDVEINHVNELLPQLESAYPDVEFEIIEGKQPVYAYVISVE